MSDSGPSTLLLEYTQDKIAVLDESGTYTYVNAAAEPILGYEPAALVGTNAFEHIHPEERETVQDAFGSVVESEAFQATTSTYRHRASDGSWVWLESRMSNVTDTELEGYVVSSRVVTDRVEAERARIESQERLAELADTTDDVLWMFDGDWEELLFCNPAYETVYGRSVEELEADPQNFFESIYPPDRESVRAALEQLSAGERVDMEYRVNPTTGYNRWVWVQGEPIVRDGEVVRIAGFSRDVTYRRRRERQLAVLDNFLRHNIRNQLTVVIGSADTLESNPAADVKTHAAMIRRAGEGLLETAEKQRDIVEMLTEKPRTATTDMVGAIQGVTGRLGDQYPEADIEHSLPKTAIVDGPGELECAIAELVENAIHHNDRGTPRVRITVESTDDRIEVTVDDTAAPIPEYDRNVLLGDHEMSAVNHSRGCGLWLVYWTVDLAGGTIKHTADERGNTVTLSLPRASERED
ncbi:PAS domain-containing sensor histidine kinase [Haloarcula montana]|uniref:PAS domain-containing sensor histidine kinase n=1 Tax=Haloarcula montana TaxID=3111776 RepID=UPI002D77161E|nr:PAS domain-containing sensor histidine kinase [Haloarcula sp. GH36]